MGNKNRKKPNEISLYELNKLNMAQIKPMDKIPFEDKCLEAAKDIVWNGNYWTLLCRELYDFTVFHFIPRLDANKREVGFAFELRDCLKNRGEVLDFTKQEDGAYEIWIRDPATKENYAYYLFKYDAGVIEI